jgi:GDPmannose 4,6-dehydratase
MKMPCKFYQAGSSEMFGGLYDGNTHLDEKCRFHPRSPYGCAKVFAHNIVVNYRESYGMFAANGILFNHESPRRGETFVTRKITKYIADLYHERHTGPLYLGNLDAKRDWGYSPEYVVAMWKILQQERPDDFVIATGETHSVAEFLDEAFQIIEEPWRKYVQFDGRYVRPAEVEVLLGNADKAARVLKWKPQVTFKDLVKIMVTADITKQETGLEEVWKNA